MSDTQASGAEGIAATIAVIGGKWKLLILWHLVTRTQRYGELRRLIPGITEKMLVQQLRELEADGVIERTAYPTIPPRVEYAFTDYGRTLFPVLKTLCSWGQSHLQRTPA